MEEKENKKLNKILKIIAVCVLIIAFSIYTSYQESIKNYSLAIKASSEGNYQMAKKYYKTAINGTLGLNPSPLLGLGKLYSMQGQYSKAEPLLIKALELSKKRSKQNGPVIIDAMYALGTLYSREGKYLEAEKLFNETLTLVDDSNITFKADIFESLGELYQKTKDYKNSEKYLLQSLNIRKKLYSEKELYLKGAYTDLAITYIYTGRYNNAEKIFKQSLKTCTQNNCSEANLTNIYMNYGVLLSNMKNYKGSLIYFEKAMHLHNDKISHNDLTTINILCALSGINLINNDKNKALELLNKALKISIQINGENSNLTESINTYINKIKNMEVK